MDAVKKLLMQHVWVTTDSDEDQTEELESKEMERENFLTDRLRIPSEWINEAKVCSNLMSSSFDKQYLIFYGLSY